MQELDGRTVQDDPGSAARPDAVGHDDCGAWKKDPLREVRQQRCCVQGLASGRAGICETILRSIAQKFLTEAAAI